MTAGDGTGRRLFSANRLPAVSKVKPMRIFEKTLVVLLLFISVSAAQSSFYVGAVFLLIPPSPAMNGMGEVGAALPSRDIFSIYYNPANFPSIKGLSLAYSLENKTQWLPGLSDDIFLHYEAGMLGYQSGQGAFGLSMGYYRTYLDLGEVVRMDEYGQSIGTFSPHYSADVVTFGARSGFNLGLVPMSFSVGGALKNTVQDMSEYPPHDQLRSDNRFYDFGFMLTAPFSTRSAELDFGLSVEPAIGYSILNMGEGVTFIDEDQADPPPTLARLGFSLSCSATGLTSRYPIATFRYGREVDDILVVMEEKNGDRDWNVDAPIGDIDIYNNLIKNKPGEDLTLHRGYEFTFLDLFTFRTGEYIYEYPSNASEDYRQHIYTWGRALHGRPILLLMSQLLRSPVTRALARHFDFVYNESHFEGRDGHHSSPLAGTDFENLVVAFHYPGS
ncbi:MAG: hypothetical protein ACETWG_07545 [Candidatus Neomarinimicrobiota bacterium]